MCSKFCVICKTVNNINTFAEFLICRSLLYNKNNRVPVQTLVEHHA